MRLCVTVDITVKIKKSVKLNTTYRVDVKVTRQTQFRAYTSATITDPEDGSVYATCEACLANLTAIAAAAKPK